MNDKETAGFAASIATAAAGFKSNLGKAKTLPKPDQEAAKKDVDLLIKQANAAKSRISEGKPASSEVRQLVEQVGRLQTFVGAHEISGVATSWQSIQASLGKLQQAFGLIK
jgi:hypothetical protein